jgi:hypothetical protein
MSRAGGDGKPDLTPNSNSNGVVGIIQWKLVLYKRAKADKNSTQLIVIIIGGKYFYCFYEIPHFGVALGGGLE